MFFDMNSLEHNSRHKLSLGEKKLAYGKILPLFFQFAIPGISGLLFLGIQILIDGILLGRYAGSNALAAINIVFPIWGVMISLSVLLNVGCQCFVGIKLGERDIHAANDGFFTSFVNMCVLMFIWTSVFFIFAKPLCLLGGSNEVLLPDSIAYLRILSFSSISGVLFLCYGGLKAQGRPFRAFLCLALPVLVNLILDILFIRYFGWGVQGAAWATFIAALSGVSVALPTFLRRNARLSLFRGRYNFSYALKMLYNGSSEGMAEFSGHIVTFLFNLTLMRYLQEDGVAAFSILGYVGFVALAFFIGLSDGVRSIISFNYGQGSKDRVLETLKISFAAVLLVQLFFFIVTFGFAGEIVSVFLADKSPQVHEIASNAAVIFSFAFLIQGFNTLVSGYFTGIGNTKLAIIISFARGIVFILIGLATLPKIWGNDGIWMTVPFAEFATLFISLALAYWGIKSLSKLGENQPDSL